LLSIVLAIRHRLCWWLAIESAGISLAKALAKALAKVLAYCCQQRWCGINFRWRLIL
jgi:hypothetical protein